MQINKHDTSPGPSRSFKLSGLMNTKNLDSALHPWYNSSSWYISEIRSSQWFKSTSIKSSYAYNIFGHFVP